MFAARRCIARTPYGVEGAPVAPLRGVNREAERLPDGVAAVKRLGVRGYLERRWRYTNKLAPDDS